MRPRLPRAPFLYAILDDSLLRGQSVGTVVRHLAEGGARLLQLRAKRGTDRLFLELAREAVTAARLAEVPLLINDRADIARVVGADGAHVGQDDLPVEAARGVLGPDSLVGISTHDPRQLKTALQRDVDYIAVGPVFQTRTKERPDPVVGLDLVRAARAASSSVIVAIGGITGDNAAAVVGAGAHGIAVISALLEPPDVTSAARRLVQAMGRT